MVSGGALQQLPLPAAFFFLSIRPFLPLQQAGGPGKKNRLAVRLCLDLRLHASLFPFRVPYTAARAICSS
jgi:hypothetical protein